MNTFEEKAALNAQLREAMRKAIAAHKGIDPDKIFMWDSLADHGITAADIVPILQKVDLSPYRQGLDLSPIIPSEVEEVYGNTRWVSETIDVFAMRLERMISYKVSQSMNRVSDGRATANEISEAVIHGISKILEDKKITLPGEATRIEECHIDNADEFKKVIIEALHWLDVYDLKYDVNTRIPQAWSTKTVAEVAEIVGQIYKEHKQ